MRTVVRKYKTIGVVPAERSEPYWDENRQAMVRDGGANWDSRDRKWVRTVWVQMPEQYKVTYDNGATELSKKRIDIGSTVGKTAVEPSEPSEPSEPGTPIHEPITPVPIPVECESIPSYWQLENEKYSTEDRPDWEAYKQREPYYTEQAPIPVTLPLSQQPGGDSLIRIAKRRQLGSLPSTGTLR